MSSLLQHQQQALPNPTATVLLIMSSATTLGDLEGMPGALLPAETFAACYYPILQAGLRVDLATVSGAAGSLDWSGVGGGFSSSSSSSSMTSGSAATPVSPAARQARTLQADPNAAQLLATPRPVAHVSGDRFDACVVLSPTGAWDLCKNDEVARVLRECANAGGAVGATGWGVAALLEAGLLGPGVAATGISNADEEANGTAAAVPFLLESRLRREGVVFSAPPPGRGSGVSPGASAAQALSAAPHVVAAKGGKVVTGYANAASAAGVARGVIESLSGGVRLLAA